VEEAHRAIDGFDPGLATALVVIETRVLVEELELLDWCWEVLIGLGKGISNFFGDRAFLTLFGVLGAIQDVRLGGLEFAGGLERQLDRVLDDFDRRLARPCGHDVDDAQRQLGNLRIGRAAKCRETAAAWTLYKHRIDTLDASIEFDDGRWQGDFLDTVENVAMPGRKVEVELSRGDSVRGVDSLSIRTVHAAVPTSDFKSSCQQQVGFWRPPPQHVVAGNR